MSRAAQKRHHFLQIIEHNKKVTQKNQVPPPSLIFNSELDNCFDPNRPAVLRDSIELVLSIKLIVSGEGFLIFFGNVNDARLRSIPDLLNLGPRCFCFSVAIKKNNNIMIVFWDEKKSLRGTLSNSYSSFILS